MALLVRVEKTDGSILRAGFTYSPVRIGRNQLNELHLEDPIVSQWHALVRFDEIQGTVAIMDLGSTNGTAINGVMLHPHTAVLLGRNDVLSLGPIRINMTLANVPPELLETSRESSFNTHNIKGRATLNYSPGDAGKTMLAQSLQRSDVLAGSATMLYQPAEEPSTLETPSAEYRIVEEVVSKTKPAYEAYRRAWTEVLRQLRARLDEAPEALREHAAIGLKLEFPQITKERDFIDLARQYGLSPEVDAEIDSADWLHRLKFGSRSGQPREHVNTRLAMERVGVLLETFAESFLALRRGYEQFGEDMALKVVQEQSPLTSVKDHRGVLQVLLDWDADGARSVDDLKRAFADLAIHQVALIHGFVEGVRHLFALLSPESIETGRSAALATTPGAATAADNGPFDFLPFVRTGRLWTRFAQLHRSLSEEDRFTREVFGRAFALAYFHVTGMQIQSGRDGTMEITQSGGQGLPVSR
jgi:type VI secretion system protein ImpI